MVENKNHCFRSLPYQGFELTHSWTHQQLQGYEHGGSGTSKLKICCKDINNSVKHNLNRDQSSHYWWVQATVTYWLITLVCNTNNKRSYLSQSTYFNYRHDGIALWKSSGMQVALHSKLMPRYYIKSYSVIKHVAWILDYYPKVMLCRIIISMR